MAAGGAAEIHAAVAAAKAAFPKWAALPAAERAKLMEQHLQAMETAMQNMQKDEGCMMMRGGHN